MGCFVLLLAMVMTQILPGSPRDSWVTVVAGFDLIRAEAFEQDRPDLLSQIYAAGSPLLARDRKILASYVGRGIVIDDLRMDVESAEEIQRTPTLVRLDVVDRLILTRVHLPDGSLRDLPRDLPTRRIVELSLTAQGWRISSMRQR